MKWLAFAAFFGLGVAGCGESECAQLPPSFELVLEIEDDLAEAQSLVVLLETPGGRFTRTYALDDMILEDETTSLAVQIDPPPATETTITVTTTLYGLPDGEGSVLSLERQQFTLQPNGCNTYSMELEPIPS